MSILNDSVGIDCRLYKICFVANIDDKFDDITSAVHPFPCFYLHDSQSHGYNKIDNLLWHILLQGSV